VMDPWNGADLHADRSSSYARVALGYAMAGLFGAFPVVWRALHRELRSPGRDSARQVAVIAGAWLAMAGCAGALDAFIRPSFVLLARTDDPRAPLPAICQDGPSQIYVPEWRRTDRFCRDLPRPLLQRAAGPLSTGIGALGVLVAAGAAAVSRRRERWLGRVAVGEVDGWSMVPYAPEWGELETIPRIVGEVLPADPELTTLVVQRVSEQQRAMGYRAAPEEKRVAWGRLDATPRNGGLRRARRGEKDVPALARLFLWTFVLSILPMMLVRWLGGMIAGV
jgi:hypothetical protein